MNRSTWFFRCIHNIEDKTDQAQACREIARVLKPGGKVLLADYVPTHEYAKALREAGMQVAYSKAHILRALTLMWMLEATKPA